MTKTCTKCGQEKPLEEYNRGQAECKACSRERSRLYREALKAKKARPGLPSGVISLKGAAKLCQDLTGFKVSADYIRSQAYTFPQIAEWITANNGAGRMVGIRTARLVGLIQGRQAARGRHIALKDIFSTLDI